MSFEELNFCFIVLIHELMHSLFSGWTENINKLGELKQYYELHNLQKRLNNYLKTTERQTVKTYDNIKHSLKTAAKESLGIKKILKSSKYWWNDEMEELITKKKESMLEIANTKQNRDLREYKEEKKIQDRNF